MQRLIEFFRQEPEKVFFLVRAVLMAAIALGVGLSNDAVETALGLLAVVLGLDYAATQKTHSTTYGQGEAMALVEDVRTAGAVPSGLWNFVLETVKRLIPGAEVPFAMAKIAGDLLQFAGKNLDAKTKAEVIRFVHTKLRQLGYLQGHDFPPSTPTSLTLMVVLVLAIGGCIPIANFVASDRAAQLTYAETGIMFLPGPVAAFDVFIDVQGSDITYLGEDELCQPTPVGIECRAEEVSDPWLIALTGFNVTAVAEYARVAGGRTYYLLPR